MKTKTTDRAPVLLCFSLLLGVGCGNTGASGATASDTSVDTDPGNGSDAASEGRGGSDDSDGGVDDGDPPVSTCETRVVEPTGYFVASDATEGGDGSLENPWTLTAALDHPSAVEAGDTIWVRGGTYEGEFTGNLVGEEGNHVTLRSYPDERVIVDGTLTIGGSWAIYRDLEVMSSDTTRVSEEPGSGPEEISHRGKGVIVNGANTRIVNCFIHDGNGAFGFWRHAVDAELYGNIVFNGGWIGPDRGHGHALYTQNENGTKRVIDNIMFNQFGRGVQAYGSPTAFVRGYLFEGNVHFNDEFLVGGEQGLVAEDITIRDNYTYNSRIRMGFTNFEHVDTTITDNYLVNHGDHPLAIQRWQDVHIARNRIHGSTRLAWLRHPDEVGSQVWDENHYFSTDASGRFEVHGTGELGLEDWRSSTGFDATSTSSALPTEPEIFVRPNAYEEGRAHVVIYNWDARDEVIVDLSEVDLQVGERYEFRNVQNYLEESFEGIYDGRPVTVPMTGWTVANPIGRDEPIEPVTFPAFGVFVVRSLGCA